MYKHTDIPPVYTLECKSFANDFNLGKLRYLSHVSSAKDYELPTIVALQEEDVLSQEERGLFSIEDIQGNGLIITSKIMFMIETLRFKILESIAEQLSKIANEVETVSPNQIIFEYIHPIGAEKLFSLSCVYSVVGITTIYEILMSYKELEISLLLPTLSFPLPHFERFLKTFFPCVSLYTSDFAVANFTISKDYQKLLKKVNRSLFNDIVASEQFTKFLNDHVLTINE